MSFSPEWNTAYSNGQRRQTGMTAALHTLFINFIGDIRGQRILELGCGVGNNAAPIESGGAIWHGVDGSESALAEVKHGFICHCCDFTRELPAGCRSEMDIVFDRASVSHNDSEGVRRAIRLAFDALKPGGIYLGSDWFSTNHSEAARGRLVDATCRPNGPGCGTSDNYPDGQFIGIGKVHFTDEQELAEIFAGFESITLTERITREPASTLFPNLIRMPWQSPAFDGKEYRSAVWDFAFRKPR